MSTGNGLFQKMITYLLPYSRGTRWVRSGVGIMIIINTSSYYKKEIGDCLLKVNIELLICSRGMLACWRR